jgi:hypothetical protein
MLQLVLHLPLGHHELANCLLVLLVLLLLEVIATGLLVLSHTLMGSLVDEAANQHLDSHEVFKRHEPVRSGFNLSEVPDALLKSLPEISIKNILHFLLYLLGSFLG